MKLFFSLILLSAVASAQDTSAIQLIAAQLQAKLQSTQAPAELKADVEIYLKAAQWILRFPEEFYKPEYAANTLAVLDRGLERAAALPTAPWANAKGRLSRAYRSRVDGSIQPYGLIIPDSYDKAKPIRLDVVLHGRAAQMNEVSFLFSHDGAKPIPADQNCIQLEIYGRTNNAYRWSGETDVFEAIDSVRKRYNIDPERIVLRGFSMGGAGAWHIGLHYPDRWAAFEAGAGFAETKLYAKLKEIPPYVESTLHIYDALDYAQNARMVPTVGYGGEIDPQLKSSQQIQAALKSVSAPRTLFLVGPQTAHKWHPDSLKQSNAFIDSEVAPGRKVPDEIHFVTYTARYNQCFWLTIDALDKHYERTEVDGTRDKLTTRNVAALSFDTNATPEIDGQKPGSGRHFAKVNGKWKTGEIKGAHKVHGLQGPLDDAFMDAFVVNGAVPEKTRAEWAKWLRGDLPIREKLSMEDLKDHAVVLFGTPETNENIRRINSKLPVRWEGKDIVAGTKHYSAADHTLKLICPNPANPSRYVVLNSTHTFGEADFKGTNALLYPRLGDWAVVRNSDGAVVDAGIFDENWKLAR